ncbi:CHAP domain-containing protein [Streptosporangium sp. NPDC023825]|uniref:CHAP domain-containing protein n=1 Tax=Streptosporangium sp. NPDC023825 TaxID=3154909 RepID=UPI0034168C8A
MRKFVELLESQLGYSEKSGGYTKFGDWYGKNVEFDADYTAAPWCDMYLSWAAEKLGYQEWIGQFAYTVHHAQWFRQQDAWSTVPKPGAIVFFDWSGSNRIDHIDHVGIVTGVEGGRIHTIEGNIDGGIAKRKERDTGKVVGYGYPEKIKARLDREATEKQTLVKPADAAGDNAVVIGPGLDLLAVLPAPVPARETRAPAGPGRPEPAPKHAGTTGKAGKDGGDVKAAAGNDGRTVSGGNPAPSAPRSDRTTAKAPARTQAPASAGRTSPGKHAKASTAGTSALAVTPTATVRDLATPAPGFDTPAVLAPVLLAAVAILAHGKARQSRVRLLATASGRTAPALSLSPSPRRTPGRRRAPGRRRMPRNAPARDLSYAPPPARDLVESLVSPEAENLFTAPHRPGSHTPANAPAPARGSVTSREPVPESTFAPASSTVFPSVTTSVAHVEEPRVPDRRDDRPRAPYRGRRRLHEHAVVESSTLVQDSPPRGRRHRRADPMVTTAIPVVPARSARPVRPTASARFAPAARPVTEPRAAAPIPAARTGQGDPAGPAITARSAAPPTEPGDILVHSGYRGRRRAEALV